MFVWEISHISVATAQQAAAAIYKLLHISPLGDASYPHGMMQTADDEPIKLDESHEQMATSAGVASRVYNRCLLAGDSGRLLILSNNVQPLMHVNPVQLNHETLALGDSKL